MKRLTERRIEALLDAALAMLAGDGEGDAEGVDFDDLDAGAEWLADQLKKKRRSAMPKGDTQ